MLLCLGTRHHDGFVRQECVSRLLERHHGWAIPCWAIPYIVQLLGEYVMESRQMR
jgi:hypothetical protein